MQPLFGLTPFKLVVPGLSEAPKYATLDGVRAYVPPSAIEAAVEAAWEAGETLGSARTQHRRGQQRRGKQRRSDHEDGEISDGGASTASSKVARGLSEMAFGRDDDIP